MLCHARSLRHSTDRPISLGQLLRRHPAIHRLASERAAFYFIANLHALTTVRDPSVAARNRRSTPPSICWRSGLDPERAVLFVQSDVPEVTELCWLLMTGAPMGLLERCAAYKDKKAKGLPADAGLFTYPVLMAADILAVRFRHRAGRRGSGAAHRSLPRPGRAASTINSAKCS